ARCRCAGRTDPGLRDGTGARPARPGAGHDQHRRPSGGGPDPCARVPAETGPQPGHGAATATAARRAHGRTPGEGCGERGPGGGSGMNGSVPTGRVWLDQAGPIGTVWLSHPGRRNALTAAMYDQFATCCAVAADAAELRVLIIRGTGEAFAAGTDITEFAGFAGADDGVAYERRMRTVLAPLETITIPVIAAVDGPAVGGGLAIAASADLIVASDRSRFGVPIARTLGNCLSAPVLARLRRRLGAG